MTAILVVCLGNICRSPLAEAAMRDAAARANVHVRVDSAGTAGYHIGKAPDQRSRLVAMERANIDISHYKARQVSESDFDIFDYIFAMDQQNLSDLKAIMPQNSKAKLALLDNDAAVVDPYYGDISDFEAVWRQISSACERIIHNL